eukprot:Skav231164  [mRNA]  locus=scaffold3252:265741:271322:- [translate_table: standard]
MGTSYDVMTKIVEVATIGSTYIVVSAGLITFNKYLMNEHRFPHAVQLTAMHMAVTTILSTFMIPLGLLFSLALHLGTVHGTAPDCWGSSGST